MNDDFYLDIILRRIRVCKAYKPRFGQGQKAGLSLEQFQQLYGSDLFYSWFGLDTPLLYAAHKAAGGITSVYRQIGVGCEELVRQIMRDHLSLNAEQTTWSYPILKPDGTYRHLSLDARIDLQDVTDIQKRSVVAGWIDEATRALGVDPAVASALKGVVFEVRQGYKSKDSKRQNADIANAATAYAEGYLPAALILSTQIDADIVYRYQSQRWLILRGLTEGSATTSTYVFARDVLHYDLEAFFERNRSTLKSEVAAVLEALLNPHDQH